MVLIHLGWAGLVLFQSSYLGLLFMSQICMCMNKTQRVAVEGTVMMKSLQETDTTTQRFYSLHMESKLNSPCRDLTKFVLPQETQQLQNKSRWELIKETLNKKFTDSHDLKASFTSMYFDWQDLMCFTSLSAL